jgi:hypothetical protein
VIANLMPDATAWSPPRRRTDRQGEEWLQTNTLDGQKAHDSFLRIGEPSFSGVRAGGYHVLSALRPGGHQRPDVYLQQDRPTVTASNCTHSVTAWSRPSA